MSELTSKLVAYCGSVQYEDLPPAAVAAAKVEILDSLGVGLGGFGLEGIQELLEVVCEWGGAAQSSVIGHAGMLPAPSAAFVNAAMMHALDYDGGHTGAFVHTGVVTIPAVFAAAERAGGMTGREMLVTAAMGTDIFCRLGLGLRSDVSKARSGWHWTTVLGYLSSAMIAGRIFGLNEEQLRHALGIAFHQCAGNTQGVASGALTKRIGPGFAVRGGLTAALMAERGITGAEDIFQGGIRWHCIADVECGALPRIPGGVVGQEKYSQPYRDHRVIFLFIQVRSSRNFITGWLKTCGPRIPHQACLHRCRITVVASSSSSRFRIRSTVSCSLCCGIDKSEKSAQSMNLSTTLS